VGFSLTSLGKRSSAAVFAAPGEVAAEAEVSLRVVFLDLPQARGIFYLGLYTMDNCPVNVNSPALPSLQEELFRIRIFPFNTLRPLINLK
jgi:hypothetical protein